MFFQLEFLSWNCVWCIAMLLKSLMQQIKKIDPWYPCVPAGLNGLSSICQLLNNRFTRTRQNYEGFILSKKTFNCNEINLSSFKMLVDDKKYFFLYTRSLTLLNVFKIRSLAIEAPSNFGTKLRLVNYRYSFL